MPQRPAPKQALWKTLLDLGRVSNIPTVWTNCLAGWLLGGGGRGRDPDRPEYLGVPAVYRWNVSE